MARCDTGRRRCGGFPDRDTGVRSPCLRIAFCCCCLQNILQKKKIIAASLKKGKRCAKQAAVSNSSEARDLCWLGSRPRTGSGGFQKGSRSPRAGGPRADGLRETLRPGGAPASTPHTPEEEVGGFSRENPEGCLLWLWSDLGTAGSAHRGAGHRTGGLVSVCASVLSVQQSVAAGPGKRVRDGAGETLIQTRKSAFCT